MAVDISTVQVCVGGRTLVENGEPVDVFGSAYDARLQVVDGEAMSIELIPRTKPQFLLPKSADQKMPAEWIEYCYLVTEFLAPPEFLHDGACRNRATDSLTGVRYMLAVELPGEEPLYYPSSYILECYAGQLGTRWVVEDYLEHEGWEIKTREVYRDIEDALVILFTLAFTK